MPVSGSLFPTFTRASVAYKQDGSQVASGVPRYEQGRSGKAIMIEEGTTNLLLAPSDFSNSAWDKNNPYGDGTGSLVEPNASIAPDGTMTADRIYDNPANTYSKWMLQYKTGLAGKTVTFSTYLKKITGSKVVIAIWDNVSGWRTLDVTSQLSITEWKQVSITAAISASATNAACGIGEGTSQDAEYYIWGAQLEGKPYATSFIDGTRAAEVLSVPIEAFDKDKFTIEGVYKAQYLNQLAYCISVNEHSNNRFNFYIHWDGTVRWEYYYYGTTYGLNSTNTIIFDAFNYIAFKYDKSTQIASIVVNDTVTSQVLVLPDIPLLTRLYLGQDWDGVSYSLNGLIDYIRISNIARTDAELLANATSTEPLPVDAYTTYKLSFDDTIYPDWFYLFQDWLETDFINAVDLNKLEFDAYAVARYLNYYLGYNIQIGDVTTNRDKTSIDFLSNINRIEENIETVKSSFMTPANYQGSKAWALGMPFDYREANRLENNLVLLYELAKLLKKNARYCGAFYCGEQGGI